MLKQTYAAPALDDRGGADDGSAMFAQAFEAERRSAEDLLLGPGGYQPGTGPKIHGGRGSVHFLFEEFSGIVGKFGSAVGHLDKAIIHARSSAHALPELHAEDVDVRQAAYLLQSSLEHLVSSGTAVQGNLLELQGKVDTAKAHYEWMEHKATSLFENPVNAQAALDYFRKHKDFPPGFLEELLARADKLPEEYVKKEIGKITEFLGPLSDPAAKGAEKLVDYLADLARRQQLLPQGGVLTLTIAALMWDKYKDTIKETEVVGQPQVATPPKNGRPGTGGWPDAPAAGEKPAEFLHAHLEKVHQEASIQAEAGKRANGIQGNGNMRIDVLIHQKPDGSKIYTVLLPGTTDMWNPKNHNPGGPAGIGDAQFGNSKAMETSVRQALDRAGFRPGDSTVVAGYSQGGIHASNFGVKGDFQKKYNVTNVYTEGSPNKGIVPDDGVDVLSVENEGDVVVEADGVPPEERGNQVTVIVPPGSFAPRRSLDNLNPLHTQEAYKQSARTVDELGRKNPEEMNTYASLQQQYKGAEAVASYSYEVGYGEKAPDRYHWEVGNDGEPESREEYLEQERKRQNKPIVPKKQPTAEELQRALEEARKRASSEK